MLLLYMKTTAAKRYSGLEKVPFPMDYGRLYTSLAGAMIQESDHTYG